MHRMPSLLLLAAMTLGIAAASGQASPDVTIRTSERQTCVVGSLDVPCSEVGAKLRDQGVPLDAHIHLIPRTGTSYQAIAAALTSLRDAGFRLKLGYVNENDRTSTPPLLASGWVQAAGEIRIYQRRADLGRLYDGSCISGVMTRMRTLPANLQNRYVAIYGSWMSAADLDEMTANLTSIGVENYCGSPWIAIIVRVVPLQNQGGN